MLTSLELFLCEECVLFPASKTAVKCTLIGFTAFNVELHRKDDSLVFALIL